MERILEKIERLEISRKLAKRKLDKLFDKAKEMENQITSDSNQLKNNNENFEKLFCKVNSITDRLVKIEEEVKKLKSYTHIHKVVL